MSKNTAILPEWDCALGSLDGIETGVRQLIRGEPGESALQQLQVQLSNPLPYDLEDTELSEYKDLAAQWHDWNSVIAVCTHVAVVVFDYICEQNDSVQE